MRKFTFIAGYDEGTYISQCCAKDLREAIYLWIKNLDVQYFNNRKKKKLREILDDSFYYPIPIKGVDSTWSTSITVSRKWLLLNIVETVFTPTISEEE